VRETNDHQLIKENFLLSQSVDEHMLHFISSTIISNMLRKVGVKIKKKYNTTIHRNNVLLPQKQNAIALLEKRVGYGIHTNLNVYKITK
jgi:hypothetical protein